MEHPKKFEACQECGRYHVKRLSMELTGPNHRYAIESWTTRWGGVTWFGMDAEQEDELGLCAVVAQGTEDTVRGRIAVLSELAYAQEQAVA